MQNSVGTYLLPIDILPIGNLPRYCLFLEFIIFYTIFFRKMCVSNDNNYYFNILYYDLENIIENNMYIVFYIINTKLMPIIILENLTKLIKPYRYLGR